MKGILKSFVIHTFVLWLIATYLGGVQFGNDPKILLGGGLALTLVDILIKPLLNLLLLPFNLVTLGTLRWVSSVFTLYISTLLVPGFSVVAFKYPGLVTNMFIIPPLSFSVIGAYIIISIIISIIVSFIFWLIR